MLQMSGGDCRNTHRVRCMRANCVRGQRHARGHDVLTHPQRDRRCFCGTRSVRSGHSCSCCLGERSPWTVSLRLRVQDYALSVCRWGCGLWGILLVYRLLRPCDCGGIRLGLLRDR